MSSYIMVCLIPLRQGLTKPRASMWASKPKPSFSVFIPCHHGRVLDLHSSKWTHQAFCGGTGDLNPSPHAWQEVLLPTELSPQLCELAFTGALISFMRAPTSLLVTC